MAFSRLLNRSNAVWTVGTLAVGQRQPFVLDERALSRHMAVFGGSGSGKSKFLELLCRRMMDDYRGFCFIDPHGDTVEDLLAYAQRQTQVLGTDAICKRIHYLEPSFDTVFGFDPFEFRPGKDIPAARRADAYHAWLHAKADKVSEIVQRKQGQSDFQGMARLQRILRDVLIAVGTPVTPDGKHLPLSDVLVLLDTFHPRHDDVLNIVLKHLPPEVRGDFTALRSYKSEDQRKKETESTINRLRSLLSPIVKAIFSCTSKTIDFREIIMKGGIVLVNLRKTDFFSADQRNAIGGLLIHEILSTAETTARENRTPYYLIVDEARLFMGEDLMEGLDQARKFKLSIVLAGQYLGQFRTEEFDMTPSVLNNCGTVLCFQQKHPDDLATWKEYFGYANLNFEELFQVMDRPDGYDTVTLSDRSQGTTRQKGSSSGASVGGGRSTSSESSRSQGVSTGQSTTASRSRARQQGGSEAEGSNSGTRENVNRSPIIQDGRVVNWVSVYGTNDSDGVTHNSAQTYSDTETDGLASSNSVQFSEQQGRSDGSTESANWGLSHQVSESEGESESVTHKQTLVPRTREEWHPTGRLRESVDDQFHKFAKLLRILPQRVAVASLAEEQQSSVIQVGDVNAPYPSSVEMARMIEAIKRKIFGVHAYYVTPGLSPANQDRRLEEFLRAAIVGIPEGGGVSALDAEENSGFAS